MNCDKIIEKFMKLDNQTGIPLSIKIHILFCSKCRNEIFSLREAFNTVKGFMPFEIKKDLSNDIMDIINKLEIDYEYNISNIKWLTPGIIILLSIFLIPFNNYLGWLRMHFGGNIEIPLAIVMGLIISVYAAIFTGTHMEGMKKIQRYIIDKVHFL